jgi:hypothetical protein
MMQMVREYKEKKPSPKWSSFESMSKALGSVMIGDIRMRRAAGIFRVPYTTLRYRIQEIYVVLVLVACEVVSLTVGVDRLVTKAEIRAFIVKGTIRGHDREFGLSPSKMRKHDFAFWENEGSCGGYSYLK